MGLINSGGVGGKAQFLLSPERNTFACERLCFFRTFILELITFVMPRVTVIGCRSCMRSSRRIIGLQSLLAVTVALR